MKAIIASKLNLENRQALQEVIPLSTPFLLYIDPSSLCNLKCVFCPTGHSSLKVGYKRGIMPFELFAKIIDDLNDFPKPIKVLRMNKVGEPLLNNQIAKMVRYAKNSNSVEFIDFATNFILFNNELFEELISAGLDRINISLEGVSDLQYKQYCGVNISLKNIVNNIKWLYSNRGKCEIVIKAPMNYMSAEDKQNFFDTFGEFCDRISLENLTSIWPGFDISSLSGLFIADKSQYVELPVRKLAVCTYIFYSMAINSDGSVSACCPDWQQQLVVGNVNTQHLHDIWHGKKMRELQICHLRLEREKIDVCAQCGHITYCQVDDIDKYAKDILQRINI